MSDFYGSDKTGAFPENAKNQRPLTTTQLAYLHGREPEQPYGGADCLALFEFRRSVDRDTGRLDPEKLRRAVASLRRHPVMRSVIEAEAHQDLSDCYPTKRTGEDGCTAPEVGKDPSLQREKRLPLTVSIGESPVVSATDSADVDLFCNRKRTEILSRKSDYAAGELGWIDVNHCGSTEIVHICVSLAVADLAGVGVILNDLADAYCAADGTTKGPGTPAGIRDVPWRTFSDIKHDEQVWSQQHLATAGKTSKDTSAEVEADALPLPPTLPGAAEATEDIGHSVTRYSAVLDSSQWNDVGKVCEAAGASRPGLILAIYRHALGMWAGEEKFCIVVPGMDTRATPNDVLDRTRAWVTRPVPAGNSNLKDAARDAGQELRTRIRLGRDSDEELRFARAQGNGHPGILPVVLTCGSESVLLSPRVSEVFGKLTHTGSITPQVLCDLQVLWLEENRVHVALDVRDGAYAEKFGEELFATVHEALLAVAQAAENEGAHTAACAPIDEYVRLPRTVRERRRSLYSEAASPALLHTAFLDHVEKQPEAIAVIDPVAGQPLTYIQLHRAAVALAETLENEVSPGDLVGIKLPKGRDQIVAVLAVLYLGAAYLPVNVEAPQERVDAINDVADPVTIIERVDPQVYQVSDDLSIAASNVPREVSPSDRAYVIFTSGSTGTPKGVVMTHSAAWNTIRSVCERHGLGREDRVLAVSELDFDLSVFDIFGLLGSGGAIVCIDNGQRRDAFAWADVVRAHNVTVWNSAPALAEMLVLVGENDLPLRLVMVSGDWVSPTLPERLRAVTRGSDGAGARLVAMGGATEGGIWSNEFVVDCASDLSSDWPSVPYGHPLPGQMYRVVDQRGRDCPTEVVGELWIGGASLAEGYLNREELTRERFLNEENNVAGVVDSSEQHIGSSGRWYRTGDHGYWSWQPESDQGPDLLFFVGRQDNQVKIRGHRIELGDVEHHLKEVDGVDAAVALPTAGNNALLALVSPEPGRDIEGPVVRAALMEAVSSFMVPREVKVTPEIRLTANGKIDRAWAGMTMGIDHGGNSKKELEVSASGHPELSSEVQTVWEELLGGISLHSAGDDPNFFALGGDSITATAVCGKLRHRGVGVAAADLFANPRFTDFVEICARKSSVEPDLHGASQGPVGTHDEAETIDPADLGEPFPLSPLQRAYGLGSDGIDGAVWSPTAYATILHRADTGFTESEVTEVAQALAKSCPALRIVRVDDTSQRVVGVEEAVNVTVIDGASKGSGSTLPALRSILEDRVPRVPVELLLPGDGACELGVLIDYIALDGRSLAEVVTALVSAFSSMSHQLATDVGGFARHCRETANTTITVASDKGGDLPAIPRIPVVRIPGHRVGFRSFRATVPTAEVIERAEEQGVTVSAYLLAHYGAVLSAASGGKDVGVVVPVGNRPATGISGSVVELGSFSSLAVCSCSSSPKHTDIQRQLAMQVDGNATPAGVSSGRTGRYPAVFTSVVGYDAAIVGSGQVRPVWSLTRTPGVLLDCQVTTGEDGGREFLEIRWDFPKEVLDEEELRIMFERFISSVGAHDRSAPNSGSRDVQERQTAIGLLETVIKILDDAHCGEEELLEWARPVVTTWHYAVSSRPQETAFNDSPVAWTAEDAQYLADVVCGKASRFSLLEHPRLSPRALAAQEPAVIMALKVLRRRIESAVKPEVVEIGFGANQIFVESAGSWTVVEPDERAADTATVTGRHCVSDVTRLSAPADFVLVCGTLHRDPRLAPAFEAVPLAVGAEVHIIEAQRLTASSLLSAALVEPSILEDGPSVCDVADLMALLQKRDLTLRFLEAEDGHTVVLRATQSKAVDTTSVDDSETCIRSASAPGRREGFEAVLEDIWRRYLPSVATAPSPLSRDTDFFLSGGDSLAATKVLADLQQEGMQGLRAVDVFNNPTFGEMVDLVNRLTSGRSLHEEAGEGSSSRWPLTRVQRAYLSGSDPDQLLGGLPARCWFIFDTPGLDTSRFRAAVESVVSRHQVLRAQLNGGGELPVEFVVRDVSELSSPLRFDDDPEAAIRHFVPDPRKQGPLTVSIGRDKVGVSMSNLLLDGTSMMRVMDELSAAYRDPVSFRNEPIEGEFDLAGYLERRPWLTDDSAGEYDRTAQLSAGTLRDRLDDVLATLPAAPLVPDRAALTMLTTPSMARVAADITPSTWASMQEQCASQHVTSAAAVMACFARSLGKETKSDALTINLTRFGRDLSVPGAGEALGDFTSLSLVGLTNLRAENAAATLHDAQASIADADAPERDALRLAVRKAQVSGDPTTALYPVVFTCGLGLGNRVSGNNLQNRSFGVQVNAGSTTPQVVLDVQVVDDVEGLHLTADYLEQVLSREEVSRILEGTIRELEDVASLESSGEAVTDHFHRPLTPSSETVMITEAWAEALGESRESLSPATNFFQEGGDSLTATTVIRRLRDNGVEVSLRTLLTNPVLEDFCQQVQDSHTMIPESTNVGVDQQVESVTGKPARESGASQNSWFELTDVQAGYLLGRTSAYEDGEVACQGYAEFALDIDRLDAVGAADPVDAVRRAWQKVVATHDMLRAVIDREGFQRIDDTVEVPLQVITVPDDESSATARRGEIREELCSKNYEVGASPMLDLVLSVGFGAPVLHLSVDLIITDYVGIKTLVADLDSALKYPDRALDKPEMSFRNWIDYRNRLLESADGRAAVENDRTWWSERLADLPPALVFSPDTQNTRSSTGRTIRRSLHLDAKSWAGFRSAAVDAGVTASSLMLGEFMAVARRYADISISGSDRALVTLTTVDRSGGPGDFTRVVGDFTSTVLVDAPLGRNPEANAVGVQDSLAVALDHQHYPGMDVLRDLRRSEGDERARVPVVFTSTVGMAAEEEPYLLHPVPGSAISKTPQVLLDVQLTPSGDGVSIDWDSREGGFHPSVLDSAFADFRTLVEETAATGETATLPKRHLQAVALEPTLEEVTGNAADALLHGPFLRRALEDPDAVAVIDADRVLTRGQLCATATAMAAQLPAGRGPLVVELEPGPEQIAAQLAALLSGRAFVPVDPTWPEARRRQVWDTLAQAATDNTGASALVPASPVGLPHPPLEVQQDESWRDTVGEVLADAGKNSRHLRDELAYVIFTSGSTGKPKGVAVTHAQIRTTLDDIHRRIGLTRDDRVLAVSRPSFDLAVFNVFGLLGVGGAVVLPSCGMLPDPEAWASDIRRYGVTVWNSVPAQLTIELDYLDSIGAQQDLGLRSVLVSGDAVPPDQPSRMRRVSPSAEFLALGGATEGSVWSILHLCTLEEDEDCLPVPYGRALSGQGMRVFNRDDEPTAPGQTGEIVIAGGAVAAGYLGVGEAGDAAFFTDKTTGERSYRTGDVGMLREDGEIVFVGRIDDRQVKIHGYRIEIGEVEAGLRSVDGISDALVAVTGEGERRELVAVLAAASEPSGSGKVDENSLKRHVDALHLAAKFNGDSSAFRRIHELVVDVSLDAMSAQIQRAAEILGETCWTGNLDIDSAAIADSLDSQKHSGLIKRWLKLLESAGRVALREGNVEWLVPLLSPTEIEEKWEEIGRLDSEIGYGTVQLKYVRDCLKNLPGLLDGRVDPLNLLFPEGDMDVAEASYGNNLLASYLNSICAGVILNLAAAADGSHPLRIMEIGGGVGGTTDPVLAALRSVPSAQWRYLFTDVSRYFTDQAQKRWPKIETGIFDINQPAAQQGLGDGQADVVLSANVLHNAEDIGQALERLSGLLSPGGIAVIIDSTADSAPLMATMEFKEGLDRALDVRAQTGSPFLSFQQWREILSDSEFETVSVMPPEGDFFELGAQHVFIVRKPVHPIPAGPGRRVPRAVADAARDVLPSYMVPARMIVADALPLTSNGKRDRAAVAEAVEAAYAADQLEPHSGRGSGISQEPAAMLTVTSPALPASMSEDAELAGDPVEDAWRDVLGLDPGIPLAGNADFHDLGGDSLLLARCIGQMRRAVDSGDLPTWDETLRSIVADPTPDGCRVALGLTPEAGTDHRTSQLGLSHTQDAASGQGASDPSDPVVTTLLDISGPVTVLIHDGSGMIGPYEGLVAELRRRKAGTVIGVERSAADGYLETAPQTLFHDLIERYTVTLLDYIGETQEPVNVVGYCMGGLLAVSIADRLAACGIDAHATTVSSYRIPFTVTDPRLLDFSFARLIKGSPKDMGIDLDEDRLGAAISGVRDNGVRTVSTESISRFADPVLLEQLNEMPLDSKDRFSTFLSSPSGSGWDEESLEALKGVYVHSLAAVAAYDELPVSVPVTFLRHREPMSFLPDLDEGMTEFWQGHCLGELDIVDIDGDHFTCIDVDHASSIADLLERVTSK